MELAMIGLGRMGANMTERLVRGGHRVVGYARSAESRQRAVQAGGEAVASLPEVMTTLRAPRIVWLMIPAGAAVDQTLQTLLPLLSHGDTVVDGGNSYYRDTLRRAAMVSEHGLEFVDVGTSGGIWGVLKATVSWWGAIPTPWPAFGRFSRLSHPDPIWDGAMSAPTGRDIL